MEKDNNLRNSFGDSGSAASANENTGRLQKGSSKSLKDSKEQKYGNLQKDSKEQNNCNSEKRSFFKKSGGKKEDSLKRENELLLEENKKLKQQLYELKDLLLRTRAEFDNYTKHVEKQKKEIMGYASKELVKDLLPVLDSFEKALEPESQKQSSKAGTEISNNDYGANEGLRKIYSQLLSLLNKHGLMEIEALGRPLDPFLHEAMLQESSDKEPGTITKVFQKGYMLNGHVLRHSKVAIARQSSDKKSKAQDTKKGKIL